MLLGLENKLVREDAGGLVFARRPKSGIGFLVIGLGVLGAGAWMTLATDAGCLGWFLIALSGILLLNAVGELFWRSELHIDLGARSYRYVDGFVPNPETVTGTLEDLEAVVLTSEVSCDEGSSSTQWHISLSLRNLEKLLAIAGTGIEEEAYRRLAHYAKRLGVPALDRTGGEERRTAPADLQKPLVEQTAPTGSVPPLPPGSRIAFGGGPGQARILLPWDGQVASPAFTILFGAGFAGVGVFVLHQVLTRGTERPVLASFVVAIILLLGLGILVSGLAAGFSREFIEEGQGDLVFGSSRFGRNRTSTRMPKRAVLEVTLKSDPEGRPRGPQDLTIRSAHRVVHINRNRLSPEDLKWLQAAIQCLVTRP